MLQNLSHTRLQCQHKWYPLRNETNFKLEYKGETALIDDIIGAVHKWRHHFFEVGGGLLPNWQMMTKEGVGAKPKDDTLYKKLIMYVVSQIMTVDDIGGGFFAYLVGQLWRHLWMTPYIES